MVFSPPITAEERAEMVRLRKAKVSIKGIARALHRCPNTVGAVLASEGLPTRNTGGHRGTPEWVEEADADCRAGTKGELEDERRRRLAKLVYGDGVPLDEARAIVARTGL